MCALFDTWLAVLLAIGGTAYRIIGKPTDPEALPIMGMLVALALSTSTQALFGFDYDSALTRMRLLPLHGWQILLSKDLAFLAVLCALVLLLDPAPALTFGLTTLAIGHHPSVLWRLPQRRWRFTSGRVVVGFLQLISGCGLGFAEMRLGPGFLIVAVTLYALSLVVYGSLLAR